jgi:hypothetical protein
VLPFVGRPGSVTEIPGTTGEFAYEFVPTDEPAHRMYWSTPVPGDQVNNSLDPPSVDPGTGVAICPGVRPTEGQIAVVNVASDPFTVSVLIVPTARKWYVVPQARLVIVALTLTGKEPAPGTGVAAAWVP